MLRLMSMRNYTSSPSQCHAQIIGRLDSAMNHDEQKALQIAHVREIEARGGSCDGIPCGPCPLDCSVVESDDIMLHVAREWLKANS